MLILKLGLRTQTNFKFPVRKSVFTFRYYSEKPKETSFYDSLGLKSSATAGEIKKAYYDLSFKYHPDRNKESVEASNKFREVNEAYEVLGNYGLRKRYDKGLPLPNKENTIERPPIVETPVKYQAFFDSRTVSRPSQSRAINDEDLSELGNDKSVSDSSKRFEEQFQKSRGSTYVITVFIFSLFVIFHNFKG